MRFFLYSLLYFRFKKKLRRRDLLGYLRDIMQIPTLTYGIKKLSRVISLMKRSSAFVKKRQCKFNILTILLQFRVR